MFVDDQLHREMNSGRQRKFIIGVAVVAGVVVLMNLLIGAAPIIGDQLQPDGVAHRLATIRF